MSQQTCSKTRGDESALMADIIPEYHTAQGEQVSITAETKQLLLAAIQSAEPERPAVLPAVKVFSRQRGNMLLIEGESQWCWCLQAENGRLWQGEVAGGSLLKLPALPFGYHSLELSAGEQRAGCRIIIAPRRCYEPTALRQGEKCWGAMIQLYTLRSASNWGMGDFGDLRQFVQQTAALGGDFVGLNPLHALCPALPEDASPYSPSSRNCLNILYISVPLVNDFHSSKAAQRWWKSQKTQQRLAAARNSEFVDYSAVASLKLRALHYAWLQFRRRSPPEHQPFLDFVRQGGDSLWQQAAYDLVLSEQIKQDASHSSWQLWPTELRESCSEQVKAFCTARADKLAFWQWLQWLAQQQYDACWQACQQCGMKIGLYRDLAVGVAAGGAETWGDRGLYCMKATIGAPPDPLGPLGQNWGLPPVYPHVMQARAYQPFIDLLRASMRSSGALRIDHVMSLLRLWWIPQGKTSDEGAYVRYPVADLLAILALESQRHRCMVIGEDLGTVPDEIHRLLRRSGIYSWKVLWSGQNKAGRYRLPQYWERQAIASVSTHDMPTLAGFWSAGDLQLGAKLGIYPDKSIYDLLLTQRARQKQDLLNALQQAGCLSVSVGKEANRLAVTTCLSKGIYRFLAQTRCALLGVQPEDWLAMCPPVNVPGTDDEYPNWRRKLTQPLETLFADKTVRTLLRVVDRQRRNESEQDAVSR